MRVLVTGGLGFIGSNLTKHLVNQGHEVIVTASGSEPRIEGVSKILYMGLDGIDYTYVKDIDVLFHLMANNDTLCNDRNEMFLANVIGPKNLFSYLRHTGCRKFIYASSTAVYGNSPSPYTENTQVDPLNVYGESKLEFDNFAMDFASKHDVEVIGLRYCNVYGPGEDRKGKRMSMIGQLIKTIMNDETPVLFENGQQLRDWAYVGDVVKANIAAWQSCPSKGEIYNIGGGQSTSFNRILEIINNHLCKQISIKYIPCPFEDKYQVHTECDISKRN
jgi:ADP-L-glycero-D-manno-heptose 6-epimerase